jgi:2-hydroxychromene-2-carboxylate isomerase
VLYVVDFADVLAQAAYADAVAAVAPEILHEDVRAVGLEGDAVVAVVDVGVLDDDVGGAVRVPSTV